MNRGPKNTGGRPPNPPSRKRVYYPEISFTATEKLVIKDAAGQIDKPIATYIRDVVLEAARRIVGEQPTTGQEGE